LNSSSQIKKFILDNLSSHRKDIIYTAIQRFGVSRQAILKHMHTLISENKVIAHGKTRDRFYELRTQLSFNKTIKVDHNFSCSKTIKKYVLPHLNKLPDNVAQIVKFSMAALLQNIIDHSNSDQLYFKLYFNHDCFHAILRDNGKGLFSHISSTNNLGSLNNAAIELVKGGVTTDKENHSGYELNAVMHLFDSFKIESNGMYLDYNHIDQSYISGESAQLQGTRMHFKISPFSKRTCHEIFKKIFDVENKTLSIPINLLAISDSDQINSRDQAREILNNISGSKKIKFDFKSVNLISPAFADELIRKIKNTDPNIEIQWINSNETIDMMMSHFLKRL
tara:strand:- start:4613 stop:5623 length:1011 start_codon:yes stop_codon:yes gene_type:complete